MAVFDFDEFNAMLSEDLEITTENIEGKMYKIPGYHSKYLKIYFEENKKLNRVEKELQKMYKEKYHYYQFDYAKKMESVKETEFHVLADSDYSELNHKYKHQKLIVDCVDRTLKRIQGLSFDSKNILETIKYYSGV